MLNRFTVSALIKSVIVLMSVCLMALLCVSAWDSWARLSHDQPDCGGGGRLGQPVQGDAQSAHRPLDDQPRLNDNALLQPDIDKYICATSATPKCRR